ncbi:putative nuclease HARBI1 [Cololabis saira]|uniref:putative nuclease HARBI1 n=1 Tax=Cololabis saira TaxID=129043 RepID=UPI002AD30F76|nr:putative nuclease HARBI1 [Cololabis saira]
MSSSSSEGEELLTLVLLHRRRRRQRQRQRHRRWYVRPLNQSRGETGEFASLVLPMRGIDDEKHREYFRMSSASFDDILRRISPLIQHQTTHSTCVTAAERLAVTLRFMATGMSYRTLAASYKLGTATVGCIVSEVCQAIWAALKDDFVAHPRIDAWSKIKEDFSELWQFPNCVGAIDGKHVRIRAPVNSGSGFFNYKGYFSIILMAVCDARYRFTVVDVGASGRESDSGVFTRSAFGSQLIQGDLSLPPPSALPGSEVLCPPVFVGDEAFPLKTHLMRPYSGTNLSAEQRIYNYRHSRARRVVENAFGILAARWRVFGKAMECSVETAEVVIKACVAVHNYLCGLDRSEQARYIPSTFVDSTNGQDTRDILAEDDDVSTPGLISAGLQEGEGEEA